MCDIDQFPSGTACNGTGSSDTVECLLCSLHCEANETGQYETLANDGRECVYHCPPQDTFAAQLQLKAALFGTDLVDLLHSAQYGFDASFGIAEFSLLDFSNQLAVGLQVRT